MVFIALIENFYSDFRTDGLQTKISWSNALWFLLPVTHNTIKYFSSVILMIPCYFDMNISFQSNRWYLLQMVQNFNYLVINCVKFLLFSNGQMQAWGVQDIIVWAGCKAQIAEIATQFSKVGVVNHSLSYLKIFLCCWGEGRAGIGIWVHFLPWQQ